MLLNKIYKGTQEICKVYKGSTLVYNLCVPPPINIPNKPTIISVVDDIPNLLLNGNFETNDYWVIGAGWQITNGYLLGTVTTGQTFQSGLSVITGQSYRLTGEISNYINGIIFFGIGGNWGVQHNSNGQIDEVIVAGSQNTTFFIYDQGGGSFSGEIDNLKLIEI